jgi:hypothetical protein
MDSPQKHKTRQPVTLAAGARTKADRKLCDQLASTREDTRRREQQFCILPTLWRIENMITRYLERVDAAKSKNGNKKSAIVILAAFRRSEHSEQD